MSTKKVSIGLVCVGMALHGAALTIGPARGAAWIGRPLDFSVPVQRDAQSEATALCAEADIFYGDSRQDPSQVLIQTEPAEQPDAVRLRVRSSALVDEPIVSVDLRVGCDQKSQRRFVLLADLPFLSTERAPAEVSAPLATLPPAEPVTANEGAPAASAPPNGVENNAPTLSNPGPSATAPTPRPTRPPAERQSEPKMAATKTKPSPSASAAKAPRAPGPRLQLDPLEILVERVKTLEIATATTPTEVVSKESQLLLRMDSDLKFLREQTTKNQATLSTLQKRLEQAESDRISAELFYGLLAMVVVCAAAIAALWQRRRAPVAVREEPVEEEPEPYEAQFLRNTLDAENIAAAPVRMHSPTPPEPDISDMPVDIDLVELNEPPWSDTSISARRRL